MARPSQLDWTLLYIKGPGGKKRPIGQVHLRPETDIDVLRRDVLPDAFQKLSRRAGKWRLMLFDDAPNEDFLPLWERPEDAERLMRAAAAWVGVCAASGHHEDTALRLLHDTTLQELARCLLGRDAKVETQHLHTWELTQALRALLCEGVRPESLKGCSAIS